MDKKIANEIDMDEIRSVALDITRDIVSEQAPEELEHFYQLVTSSSTAYEKQNALAFGLGDLLPTVSPVMLNTVILALGYVVKESFDLSLEIAKDEIKHWLLERREKKRESILIIPPKVLQEVNKLIASNISKSVPQADEAARLTKAILIRLFDDNDGFHGRK